MVAKVTRRALIGAAGTLVGVPTGANGGTAGRTPARRVAAHFFGLRGDVILPGDQEYAEARMTFNSRISRHPAAIVLCSDAGEVGQAVRWARRHGVELRVRSGGHSYEGYSVGDDALVIDLGRMTGIEVDPVRQTAAIGAGARLIDLYRALGAHGLALPAGTCPGVGIAGLTLGGGIGFLSRSLGLTCDNLVAVEFVDAVGRRNRASEAENPDLFWAMRGGGGGNFGIATAFTFRATPLEAVALCRVEWPWEDAAAVLDAWQRWAPFADPRLTIGLAIPGGGVGVVSATGMFTGPASELPGLLAPVLAAGVPAAPLVWTASFIAACEQLGGPPVPHATFKNASAMVYEPLGPLALATLVERLRTPPGPSNLVGFFPLGGAVASIDPAATAFPHRRARFDVQYQSYWGAGDDGSAGIAWVRGVRDAMRPFAHGAYANYVDADPADWATDYYGDNLPRLARVKAAWDPTGVFSVPQAIGPSDADRPT